MKTTEQLNKAIQSLATRGRRLDNDFQKTGLDVLEHFAQHHDVGLVNRLFLAVPRGGRKSAMADWILTYFAVSANTDAKTKTDAPFRNDKEKHNDAEGAAADPWYDHKPEPAVDELFDVQKAVAALLRKASKAKGLKNGDRKVLSAIAQAAGLDE